MIKRRPKPKKRTDPAVPMTFTITTSQYLRLDSYCKATGLTEQQAIRAAIGHFVGGISEWQR
jgi:hypothetical protein